MLCTLPGMSPTSFVTPIDILKQSTSTRSVLFVLLRLTIAHQLERTIPNEPRDIQRQLYVGLAEAYSESGFTEKAIEIQKECVKIHKEAGNKRRESESYEHIGRMYLILASVENR